MITATQPTPPQSPTLSAAIMRWWEAECMDWDTAVTVNGLSDLPGGPDLWDDMPTVDSKAIARTSPLFEHFLGVPLDVKLIRPGGYDSIEDAIADLVPKMQLAARNKSFNKRQRALRQ